MLATRKTTHHWQSAYDAVDMMVAWGMAILLTTFLFLFIEHRLGGNTRMGLLFIVGLLTLAAVTMALRFISEARKIR
ncbi:MAG: hypothetical protein ABSB79_10505, partial [Syntrophales bacterium]|jgi:hypothetical protein